MGGRPLGTVEWHSLHAPAVVESQVAVPTLAPLLRPVVWQETPAHVSSLPFRMFGVYNAIVAEELGDYTGIIETSRVAGFIDAFCRMAVIAACFRDIAISCY